MGNDIGKPQAHFQDGQTEALKIRMPAFSDLLSDLLVSGCRGPV